MQITPLKSVDPPLTLPWNGGLACVKTEGNFGGGTLTVTYSEKEDGVYVPIGKGFTFTDGQLMAVWLPVGYLKFELSGGTAANIGVGIDRAHQVAPRM